MENTISTFVLKGKKYSNPKELYAIYDQAFKAWHETWENTYKYDFHSDKNLPSDEFTRQDEILVLSYQNECAALCFFSHVDLGDFSATLDSYFSCWPEKARTGLCVHGSDVIICSQFTVMENFRKEGPLEMDNAPWKIVLMGMLSKYFLHSQKSAMTGTMRVNKGMGKLTALFGTVPLIENMEYQAGKDQTLVDLVAFYQENVERAYYDHSLSAKMDKLWETRNQVARKLKLVA